MNVTLAPHRASERPADAISPELRRRRQRTASAVALGATVATAAVAAVLLQRNGHTQGDDFALYLRQARSVFDGDTAQVVADNRFTVINSNGPFSPIAYPWGWPLLLAPFVHLWGLDYDRLKLVEVACFCIWLVLVHGVIRRRAGRLLATAVTAAVATVPLLLAHTDQLLSEYPHAMVLAAVIWWWDRVSSRASIVSARTRDLVVLGVLAALAFNVRRESVVLVGALAVTQLVEVLRARRDRPAPIPWRAIGTPYLAFIGAVVGFHLLMPTMLFPDNGDSPRYLAERLGGYVDVLSKLLGLGEQEHVGAVVVLLALAGIVVACVRRPRLDVPLAALTVLTALAVSTHLRLVDRYYFQILPWVLYFAAMAIVAAVGAWRDERARRVASVVAAVPLLVLVAVHLVALPDDVQAARDFDRGGRQQVGPTEPSITPIYDAVLQHTPPEAVVVYYRARTMTLLTDRRTVQTTQTGRMLRTGGYWAQLRGSTYWQPELSEAEALELGLVEVWSDPHWILWELPDPN